MPRNETGHNLPGHKPAIGIDVGTYTIVSARREESGDIGYREEVNGFFEIKLSPATRPMFEMVRASGAPVYEIPEKSIAYILGKKAREVAFAWSSVLGGKDRESEAFNRTMCDGIISTRDSRQSFNVLRMMVSSLVYPVPGNGTPIAYSYPGVPIDKSGLDPEYHARVIGQMLADVDGVKPDAYPVNEAMAIVEAEASGHGYTALAISFGAGMTNCAFSMMGIPIFTFSIVGGGDWIDRNVAKSTGTDPVVANQVKMGEDTGSGGIDLMATPHGENEHIMRSIRTHYEILVDRVVAGIEQFVRQKQAKVLETSRPPVIVAGGTASPKGFVELFAARLAAADLGGFKIGDVRKADRNLYTVAKGLLLNAERLDRKG
jgi:hypothetical protein